MTSTGDKGFVSFQGTDYVLDDNTFRQFKAGYEQAQKQSQQDQGTSFATLGVDPRKWLTDPQNAGEAKVGDTDTIKITGGVDVAKLLDDVNAALEKASSLGVSGAQGVPEKLTEQQRQQVLDAVKDPKVEIYTGKDDKILRRMVVNMGIDAQGTSGTVIFDVSITDLNEDQDIAEPQDAKPFTELLGPARRARPRGRRRRVVGPARAPRRAAPAAAARPRTCRSTPTASRRPARTSRRRASAPTS